jgi:hypothetical protein
MLRTVLDRLELANQLPPSGWRRTAVLASLVTGALVATGLTALIVVFVAATLKS